jgi:hypothetical protein
MELFRLHAFAVSPQRTAETPTPPSGGAIAISGDLRSAFTDLGDAARTDARTEVDFQVDTTTRTNDVRDLLLAFGFGSPSGAKAAAVALARKLASSMDRRSAPCLLFLAALREGNRRRVAVWTFPQDEAFRLQTSRRAPSVELLKDVFSRSSRLRKAAFFEGARRRTDFLRGLVFDSQAMSAAKEAADFWIVTFLECVLAFHGEAGTRHLARSLRGAYDLAADPNEQEQLSTAVMAIRQSPQRRWSLRRFAETFLSGPARGHFLEAVPNDAVLESPFDFQQEIFDQTVGFRVFRLDSNVFVSAPFDEIGRSVTLEGHEQRRLRCEGQVVEEKVKARHG